MEKLVNLLNEYRRIDFVPERQEGVLMVAEEKVISKKFWFIEWLYDHKKMTLERLKVSDLYWDINDWVWPVDNIIMHLSISENPIELLISLLK